MGSLTFIHRMHVSADTQRGTEREPVPLTQRAAIVSAHQASCQREGEREKFRRGMGSQVPSLKLGGGKKKNQGEAVRSAKKEREGGGEGEREGGSISPPNLLPWSGWVNECQCPF